MQVFITGTDTGVGKTVVAAWLCIHKKFTYWKPIQTGCIEGTDTEVVRKLGGQAYAETYRYQAPLSPHLAAAMEGDKIELDNISLPTDEPMIIEGAGGVLVPINHKSLMVDLIQHLATPTILVARSTLGTINHTLLSLDALRARNTRVLGVIMVGPINAHNRYAIEQYGKTEVLAELPMFAELTIHALEAKALPERLNCILETSK